jgi:AcrR family transcriptional regulator
MEAKQIIQAKSFELFKKYGIRSITMDEIAVHCGMSKKTLYQVFADKDSLVHTMIDEHIAEAERSCKCAQSNAENAIQEIFVSMDWVHQMFDGVNPVLLFDLRKYHAAAFQKLEKHKTTFLYDIFKSNFERGIAEGLYRPEIKIDVLVPLRIHTLTLVFENDLFPSQKYTLFDMDWEITLHDLYGVATLKGTQLIEKYIAQRTQS